MSPMKQKGSDTTRWAWLFLGPGFLLLALLLPAPKGMTPEAMKLVGVTALMAVWWMGEVVKIGVHPFVLMIPAIMSASCAFMLPVATPPNAIMFGSGCLDIPTMAKTGIAVNLLGLILITLLTFTLGVRVLDISPELVPVWAVP